MTFRPWLMTELATLKRLWNVGYTAAEITHHLPGRSRSAICAAARRHDLPRRIDPIERDPVRLERSRYRKIQHAIRGLERQIERLRGEAEAIEQRTLSAMGSESERRGSPARFESGSAGRAV